MSKNLIAIVGPTGVGKTDISIELATHFEAEIISADSRQIYKELNIGTAVPSKDQLNAVPHHFIQTRSVTEYYNASLYEQEVISLTEKLFEKSQNILLVGGSTLYVDSVCFGIDDIPDIDEQLRNDLLQRVNNEGIDGLRLELKKLDPEYYSVVDLKNKNRILRAVEVSLQTGKPYSSFRVDKKCNRNFNIVFVGLNRDREELYNRINLRVESMIEEGLVEEAKEVYHLRDKNALKTVGYRELFDYFDGKHDIDTAIDLIKRNSRKYARRQITWFKRYKDLIWFQPEQKEEIINHILKEIERKEL